MENKKLRKPILEKVKNPIYIKIVVDNRIFLTCGTMNSICDTFGIGRPLIPENLTLLIKSRVKADSVTKITRKQFAAEMSEISDSEDCKIRLI